MSDINDWDGQPGSQDNWNMDPTQHAGAEWFSDEAIELERGSLPWLMVPVAFFFMPGRFMRSTGVHLSTAMLIFTIWITGTASTISSIENRSILGNQNVLSLDSWAMLWGVAIVVGLLRGYVIYGLGGVWYRLRLKMCGLDHAEWRETGRVYMISGLAKQSFYILYMIIASTMFISFESYLQDDNASIVFSLGFIVSILVLEICASITLFCGSIAVFPIKKAWAAVWLLVLPILLRVTVIGGLFAIALIGTIIPPPQINSPSRYTGEMIQMEYPRNWSILENERNPGPKIWVQSSSLIGDALIEIEIVYSANSEDMFAYAESDWQQRVDLELVEIREEGDTNFAGQACAIRDRLIMLSGTQYVMKMLHWKMSDSAGVLVCMIAPSSAWDTVERGYEHIISTLKVNDPMKTPPDLDETFTAHLEEIQFKMPGNWWFDRTLYDDTENEDGSVTRGTRFLEAEAPGDAYFRAYLYESGLGPRTELAAGIEGYAESGRLENEQSFGEWNDMEGFGAHGQVMLNGIYFNMTIFVTSIEDGRLLEIRKLSAVDQESVHAKGFELIESTFELRNIEPTSP